MHYTNYRVNPGATPEDIANIEGLRQRDPALYDVVGIGLPGVPKGGVYSHLLKHVSRLIQPGNVYTAGLDWGFKHDPLTVILLQTQETWETVNVIEEFQLTNYSRYSNEALAHIVVRWLKSLGQIYPKLVEDELIVFCDKSNITFIEMLNTAADREDTPWLMFVESEQIEIEHRIGFKQGLISASRLNISTDCKYLYQELLLAVYDTKATKLKLLDNCDDHMMDAFDYALIP